MNVDDIETFYRARDARTTQYGGNNCALETEIVLICGEVANTRPGQAAVLAMVNMMARTHRRFTVSVPTAKLVARSLITASSLEEAVVRTVLAINPAAHLVVNGVRLDANAVSTAAVRRVSLGVDTAADADVHIGWSGGRGLVSTRRMDVGSEETDVLGAATAACMGVHALFELSHGRRVHACALNLAERRSCELDTLSPCRSWTRDAAIGDSTITGPIDVGDVAVIGAGAVAHGLGWWAQEFGHLGTWATIDGDVADISNTNRCMGMTASDAGWPAGLPTSQPGTKADILAGLLSGPPVAMWFDQWIATGPERRDLLLPLANERGVRAHAAALGEPILLHATTSASWTAELHRHVPSVDDCPTCRLPGRATPQFACSTGPASPDPGSADAALPFLSAAAGLLLIVAMQQLTTADSPVAGRHNHFRLCFERGVRLRRSVHPGRCPHTLTRAARRAVQASEPRRFDRLDVEANTR
ncbi:hypothetical protein Mycch_6000 (plasmid) [Mycolicibacterium chubuense NBB4]|uniref:ThiF family protein n=1 Tax=Mycolicibacterium chubuense (strain NBB4) TaxID=710421 RepID=I4BTJ5_MYCCN|nr:hypothetical protein [Mycolicibacterium chubuense]AFM20602.1 hypothetical protein Mycch_6000 [Mycolicibacterium chubuense NBB4]